MKKLFSLFSSIAVVGPAICSVVACNLIKPVVTDSVWVVTDGGTISDKSFNEQSWDAAKAYSEMKGTTPNYIETLAASGGTTPSSSDFVQAYQIAKLEGANYVIMPGFKHGNSLQQANDVYALNDGGTYGVFLDGTIDTEHEQNLIGIQYAAEISGIEAGIASALFLYDYHNDPHYSPNLATYGGMSNPLSVNSYMWGFIEGARVINFAIHESDSNTDAEQLLEEFNGILSSMSDNPYTLTSSSPLVKMDSAQIHNNWNESTNPYSYGLVPYAGDQQWFSGTFDPTDQAAKAIIDLAFSNGSDVIMPVAGPQSNIVLNEIPKYESKMGKDLFLVGVDSDASEQYPDSTDKIITSSLKNLEDSSIDVMSGITDGTIEPGQNFTYNNQPDPSTGINYNSWMGISKNQEPINGVQINDSTLSYFEDETSTLYNYINELAKWYEDSSRDWASKPDFTSQFNENPNLSSPDKING